MAVRNMYVIGLNQLSLLEKGAQVDDLPCSKPGQHNNGEHGEPQHARVCTLCEYKTVNGTATASKQLKHTVCVPHVLLSSSLVGHFTVNLLGLVLQLPQLKLQGLQVLLLGDLRVVTCINTDLILDRDTLWLPIWECMTVVHGEHRQLAGSRTSVDKA